MILVAFWTFITGLVIGWYTNIAILRSVMQHNPNELIERIQATHAAYRAELDNDDEDIDDPNSIIVSLEHINSHWYLYDVSTNIFAGQGKSLEEAVAAVEARFPNREVVIQEIKEPA
jgi:hypothetical protein